MNQEEYEQKVKEFGYKIALKTLKDEYSQKINDLILKRWKND